MQLRVRALNFAISTQISTVPNFRQLLLMELIAKTGEQDNRDDNCKQSVDGVQLYRQIMSQLYSSLLLVLAIFSCN